MKVVVVLIDDDELSGSTTRENLYLGILLRHNRT
jgi:hypothetical protein